MTLLTPEPDSVPRYSPVMRFGIVLGACFIAIIASLTMRYGSDTDAWSIAVSHTDLAMFLLIILGIPIGLLLDAILRKTRLPAWGRFALLTTFGLVVAASSAVGRPDFETMFGVKLPTSAKILSTRYYHSFAGGGEEHLQIQFTLPQADFDQLIEHAALAESEGLDPGTVVDRLERGLPFRYAVPFINQPKLFEQNNAHGEEKQVLWDANRLIAYAVLSRD